MNGCVSCGHDPACGFASVSVGYDEFRLCHVDTHSCFASEVAGLVAAFSDLDGELSALLASPEDPPGAP